MTIDIFIIARVVASFAGLLLVFGGGVQTVWSTSPMNQISGIGSQLTGIGFLIVGMS